MKDTRRAQHVITRLLEMQHSTADAQFVIHSCTLVLMLNKLLSPTLTHGFSFITVKENILFESNEIFICLFIVYD